MGHRVLSLASEWFSYHGGLSTFNRSFCGALAAAGHEVICLVPRATAEELKDAAEVGVRLAIPAPLPGLSDEALLCLDVDLGFEPDIVVGHGHVTGAVAAARVRQYHKSARRIHVLHTLPDEIEPFKDREGEDPAKRAHRKQEAETALSISADLAVAVGPRLYRQWSTYIAGARSGVAVHRLTPGLSDLKPVESIPAGYWCLLMGRLEDAQLKGVDLAAIAMGIINKNSFYRGSREVTLVLRGAEAGKSKDLRSHVYNLASAKIPCMVREYTHQEEHVRQDIARSSVLLMPSQMEGFGLVGFEALAMGVPILVSQRSGLGELLLELIDTDSNLEFARSFIVDVGDSTEKDAERWAEAIQGVLGDREKAFKQTAILRAAILKADYWRRAVQELLGVLKIPPRDPDAPTGPAPDLMQRARRMLAVDPAMTIMASSALLEREMERFVTSLEIGKAGLPASTYLTLLRDNHMLEPQDVDLTKSVLHLRNMAAHKFDVTFTREMAEEHMGKVETLVKKLLSKRIGSDAEIGRHPEGIGGASDQFEGLRALQQRFVAAQDRFPREVSFAVVMIPHDEWHAWDTAYKWYRDFPKGRPQPLGYRCLSFAAGGDRPETVRISAEKRSDGIQCPLLASVESWECWLRRRSENAPFPTEALSLFHSLAKDACRVLDLRDCGMDLDGRHFEGKRAEYQHLLRWTIEKLSPDECEKLTWFDPPNEHLRTTWGRKDSPKRWYVEMPCVFAAVALALERHMKGLGNPWPPL